MTFRPKYKRILLKITGEAFSGERDFGIDLETIEKIAREILEVKNLGVKIAFVC